MVKENIFTFPVSIGSYQKFIDEIFKLAEQKTSSYVCFANVHMVVEAYNDPHFQFRSSRMPILLRRTDSPLRFSYNASKKIDQERVAGLDVFPDLLKEAEAQK